MDIKTIGITFYGVVLILLALYSIHLCVLVILSWWHRKDSVSCVALPEVLPVVTIQLPIYNERYVVERLISSVCSLDYPKNHLHIQVLDDSDDDTIGIAKTAVSEYLKKGFDIEYIHRQSRIDFKAGALRQGLETAKGEYIAVFDADFVPQKDFLKRLLPYFSDDNIGMVQARWGHINSGYSVFTKVQAMMLDIHFTVEQLARHRTGCFINFNGTAGIWRKQCILEAGNWSADTLSEDMDLSYRAQLKGWRFVFTPDVIVPAELPVYVSAFKSQQYRWAQGTFQCAKKHLYTLLFARIGLFKKIQAIIHLTNHLSYPLLLLWGVALLPVSVHLNKTYPLFSVFHIILLYLIAIGNPLLACFYAWRYSRHNWNLKLLPALLLVNCGMSLNNTLAILRAILTNNKPIFIRTPKFGVETKRIKSSEHNNQSDVGLGNYFPANNRNLFIEIVLGCFCSLQAIYYGFSGGVFVLPFFLTYSLGFFYIAGMELLGRASRTGGVCASTI